MFIRIFVLSLLLSLQVSFAQERYYYHGRNFGSEALFNPVTLLLNSSFDILQLEEYPRDVFSYPYRISSNNVMRNLGSPFATINRYGWGRFLQNEVFPLNWSSSGGQWLPNYELHLVGGGMNYVATREWYSEHGFPSPAVFSIATMAMTHTLNEFVENGNYEGDNVDPIADIFLFDAGGIVLFSFDGVNEFFSRTLNLADWSLQPSYGVSQSTLQNNGQYYSLKWKFPFSEQWHLFYYFGMNGLLGVSYKDEHAQSFSVGAGLRSKHLRLIDPSTNQKSAELAWNVGFFYDKDNSLLASVLFSGLENNLVNVNVYPGVLGNETFSPGVWLSVSRHGNIIGGISTIWLPGISFGNR